MTEEKDKWSDWFLMALVWYVPAGILFYSWRNDETLPMWGWGVAYVLSPLIVGVLGLLGYGILFLVFVLFAKAQPYLDKYFDVLSKFEKKSKDASIIGAKWKSFGWKIVWAIIALPFLFFLLGIVLQDR